MKFPYWRHVRGTDDGCDIYQCLWCGADWESRTSPSWDWKFCPICGFKWNGEHECVEHGSKMWELEKKYGRVEHIYCNSPKWLIQSRLVDTGDGRPLFNNQDWSKDGGSWEMDSLFDALRHKKAREDEENDDRSMSFGTKVEFRIVRWYPSAKSYGCGDVVVPGQPSGPTLEKFAREHAEDRTLGGGIVTITLSGEIEADRRERNVRQSVS